jgi:thiol-disulfide isomerase/thioredoxin
MYPVKGAPEASEFALPDVDGSTHRLSDYRGRFVLVNFWAVWCAPCRKEMPSLDQGYKALSDRAFTTIGVHVGPSREDIVRFMGDVPVSFTILLDEDMEMSDWGVRGLPTTVLVDPGGRMIYRSVGEKDWASPQMLEFLHDVMDGYETAATKIVRGAAPRRAAGRVDGDGDGDGG